MPKLKIGSCLQKLSVQQLSSETHNTQKEIQVKSQEPETQKPLVTGHIALSVLGEDGVNVALSKAKKRRLRKKRIIEVLGLSNKQTQGKTRKKRRRKNSGSDVPHLGDKTNDCYNLQTEFNNLSNDVNARNFCLELNNVENVRSTLKNNNFCAHITSKRVINEVSASDNSTGHLCSAVKNSYSQGNTLPNCTGTEIFKSELESTLMTKRKQKKEKHATLISSTPFLSENLNGHFCDGLQNNISVPRSNENGVKKSFTLNGDSTEKATSRDESVGKLRKSKDKNLLQKKVSGSNRLSGSTEALNSGNISVSGKIHTSDSPVGSASETQTDSANKIVPCNSTNIDALSVTAKSFSPVAGDKAIKSSLCDTELPTALSLHRNIFGGPIYTSPNFENRVTNSAESNQIFSSNKNSSLISSSLCSTVSARSTDCVKEISSVDHPGEYTVNASKSPTHNIDSSNKDVNELLGFTDKKCENELLEDETNLCQSIESKSYSSISEPEQKSVEVSKPSDFTSEVTDSSLSKEKIVTSVESTKIFKNTNSQLVETVNETSVVDNCVSINTAKSTIMPKSDKTREEIKAEREAKKLSKQAKKSKTASTSQQVPPVESITTAPTLEVAAGQSNTSGAEQVQKSNAADSVSQQSTVLATSANGSAQEVLVEQSNTSDALKLVDGVHSTQRTSNRIDIAAVVSGTEAQCQSQIIEQRTGILPQQSTPVQKSVNASDDEKVKERSAIMKQRTENSTAAPNTSGKSKAELKAERRAKQEAQRAAKLHNQQQKSTDKKEEIKIKDEKQPKLSRDKLVVAKKTTVATVSKVTVGLADVQHKVKLFNHLYPYQKEAASAAAGGDSTLHPAIVRLGIQYKSRVIAGSNARCVALLHAVKQVIEDYRTPSQQEFSRGLEICLRQLTTYLHACRPLPVSATNALRHLKWQLTLLPNNVTDADAKKKLHDAIDTYIREQIDVAGQAICNAVLHKITNGDTILTYGCSSLLTRILLKAHESGKRFQVVVADGRPWLEGREMLRRLLEHGLPCSYVLLPAASFIMHEVTKVLLGAHALLANGYVMSRAGSSQIALLAHTYNVPVLVCCETHKFSERVQTDSFVYNEIGDPDALGVKGWHEVGSLTPLNLTYDVTPPDLVTAVVTELAILPCTSVPVILRIKPSETGF